MCSFSLQEVKFFEIPLVILFYIFRIVFIFSPCLEEFSLPRGVNFIFTMERAIKRGFILLRFLPFSSRSLNLKRFFCLLVALSSSEAENLATVILSVVSACSNCSIKVARYHVSGLKPCNIYMALWLLGALLARESTSLDSSSCWFSSNMCGICAILELGSRTNPNYFHVVSLQGLSIL